MLLRCLNRLLATKSAQTTVVSFDCACNGHIPDSGRMLCRSKHQESLGSVLGDFYSSYTGEAAEVWSTDDVVRFESYTFVLQNVLCIVLRMVSQIVLSCCDERVSVGPTMACKTGLELFNQSNQFTFKSGTMFINCLCLFMD